MNQKRRHLVRRWIKILAAVRISKASGRDMLSGMFRFIEQNPFWQLHLIQYDSDFTADVVRRAPAEGFNGIVVTNPGANGTLDALAETPLPVVLVSVRAPKVEKRRHPIAFIGNDNGALGRLAAASFLKNGNYASYAYIPKTDEDWCVERGESFAAALAQSGRECSSFVSEAIPSAPVEDTSGLVRFLSSLAKPAAVYAASDECAMKVLAAAHVAGIKMPECMALIGTDNDEFLVRHSNPPVTSILPGHFKMGLRAMLEMKKLLSGSRGPGKPIYIPPVSIMERTSTKPALPAAALVKRAKAYIASYGCGHIEVDDIVGHLGVSRRLAELRFRQMEGMSLRRAIENHRLEEAKRLLARTDLSVTAIAERIGFSGQNRLSHVFKARFNIAPELWRMTRKHGGRVPVVEKQADAR